MPSMTEIGRYTRAAMLCIAFLGVVVLGLTAFGSWWVHELRPTLFATAPWLFVKATLSDQPKRRIVGGVPLHIPANYLVLFPETANAAVVEGDALVRVHYPDGSGLTVENAEEVRKLGPSIISILATDWPWSRIRTINTEVTKDRPISFEPSVQLHRVQAKNDEIIYFRDPPERSDLFIGCEVVCQMEWAPCGFYLKARFYDDLLPDWQAIQALVARKFCREWQPTSEAPSGPSPTR